MIITCEDCNASFDFNENLLEPTGSKVRCSKCGHIFRVFPKAFEEQTLPVESSPESQAAQAAAEKEKAFEGELDLDLAPEPGDEIGTEDLDLPPGLKKGEAAEAKALAGDGADFEVEEIDLSDIKRMLDDSDESEAAEAKALAGDGADFEAEEIDLSDIERMLDDSDESETQKLDFDDLKSELELKEASTLEIKNAAEGIEPGLEDTAAKLEQLQVDDAVEEIVKAEAASAHEAPLAEQPSESVTTENLIYEEPTATVAEPQKAAKPARKKTVGTPVLALLIIVLLAGIAVFALLFAEIDLSYVSDFPKNLPYAGKFLGSKVEDVGNRKIAIYGLGSKFVENTKNSNLFVIIGKARNDYASPRRFIKVSGKLYPKSKKLVKTQIVLCGNVLSNSELSKMSMEDIRKRLMGSADIWVDPGKHIPFMIVFSSLPENLNEFSVEVIESQAVAK